MAKISILLPETFTFSTELDVLTQHINAGQHLANEQLVALLNEARMRFMATLPLTAFNIPARAFINTDLAVIYKSEAHYGDRLKIEVAADDFNKYGCDFVYRVTQAANGALVATAKTAMLMFDYEKKQLKLVPENFQALFNT
jgi:4-hydroxybenzoyl-CoA thioesterase